MEKATLKMSDGGTVGYIKYHYVDDPADQFKCTIYTDFDLMCYDMAKFYAFSDLDDSLELIEAYWDGEKVTYGGWEPQMCFSFYIKGELVWRNWFDNWDH